MTVTERIHSAINTLNMIRVEFPVDFDRLTEAWSPDYRAKYRNKIHEQIRQSVVRNERSVRDAIHVVRQMQKEVVQKIALTPPEKWRAFYLPELERELDTTVAALEERLRTTVGTAVDDEFEFGISDVDEQIELMDLEVPVVDIMPETAETAARYSADLITNLVSDTRAQINGVLRRGILSGESLGDVITKVGRNLKDPSVFSNIRLRAEVITRTETARMRQMAAHSRKIQAMERNPGLKKIWINVRDLRTRDAHREAGIRYAPGGEPGPIPVDKPFIVGGEKLMFPGDPAGSAKNTIQCRCDAPVYREKLGKPAIEQDLKENTSKLMHRLRRTSKRGGPEWAYSLGGDGLVRHGVRGQRRSVGFTLPEQKMFQHSRRIVHNHASSGPPSPEDFLVMAKRNSQELITPTPDYWYRLKKKNDKPFRMSDTVGFNDRWKAGISRHFGGKDGYLAEMKRGKVGREQGLIQGYNQVWKDVADEMDLVFERHSWDTLDTYL